MDKKFLLAFVLAALVMAGCTGGGGSGRTDRPTEIDYRRGTDGLVLSFPVGTLTKLYENDQNVKMVVEARNKGAFPQFDDSGLNAHIWLGGFDNNIIELLPEETLLDESALEGKSPYNLEGGYLGVVINGKVYNLPSGTSYYKPTLKVTVTYKYKTIAAPEVCIDPNPRSTDVKEKVCDITRFGSVSLSSSQGAPVAVTRVDEDATHDSTLFKFYIQNVGKGLVIDENDISNDPNKGYDWDEMNKVRLADVSIGNRKITECRPDIGSYIDLINDKGYVFCKFSTAGINTVYTSPLNIILEYGYANSIDKDIEIFEEIVY